MTDCLHKKNRFLNTIRLTMMQAQIQELFQDFNNTPHQNFDKQSGCWSVGGSGAVRYHNCTFVNFERKNDNNNFRITCFLLYSLHKCV